MIDPLEIRKEIARLEYEESSYPNYAKLATLYTIRAEMAKGETAEQQTVLSEQPMPKVSRSAESDFFKAISGKSQDKVFEVLDELVDSLSVSQPKLYSAVINKLNRL